VSEAAPQPDVESATSPEPDGRAAYERDRAARRAAEVEADEELAAAIARGERPRMIADGNNDARLKESKKATRALAATFQLEKR
jgi:hypothetical protein